MKVTEIQKKFHLSTLEHRAKTRISSLNKCSMKLTKEKEISEEMVSFFSSLVTSDPNIDLSHHVELLDVIPSLVTKEKKRILSSIHKEEEIYKAVCSLAGDKSPGLNDFPMFFLEGIESGKERCV